VSHWRPRRGHVLLALGALSALLCAWRAQPVRGQSSGVGTDVEIAALLDTIEASTARHGRLETEAAELTAQRRDTQLGLRNNVRALYRITRSGLSPLVGGMDAVLRHVARIKRLQRLIAKQSGKLNAIDGRTRSLQAARAAADQALRQARARLSALQSGQASSSGIDGLIAQSGEFRAAGDESGGSFYGMRMIDPPPSSSFESARGNLASPVTGDVQLVSAQRAESDGPGLELRAPVGTAVRAVAAGRVAFSDRYGSYGRLVILDHGDGYYTVYGGLGAVEVRVGDDLSRSARIGSVGTDFSPPALFFEVRKGTRTLEPRGWLGL
jgi:septal ring factor EnvC (AmiA/AmiB activator)